METTRADDKRGPALHEAGHSVARVRVGRLLPGITSIVPTDDRLGISTGEEAWGSEEKARDQTLILCAGYAALVAAGYNNDKAEEGCGSDFSNAEEIIEGWALGTLDKWKKKAVFFMSDPKNIQAVKVVAEKLIERSILDGDRLQVLIELADGDATEDEWLRFDLYAPKWGNIS
jgi:hypothetical protein